MPLPDGEVTVNGGDNELKTGMTMKIPHDLWLLFEKAAKDSNGRFKVSLEDGFVSLFLPVPSLIPQPHPTLLNTLPLHVAPRPIRVI